LLCFLPGTAALADDAVVAIYGVATLFWLFVAPPWLDMGGGRRRLRTAVVGWVVLIGAWVALVALQARAPWLVLAAMAVVWIADTAAYFTGRAFGRHKLAPEISPGKTWEGVYGALAGVGVYALALVPFASAATQATPLRG
jgi:phosphatidate cytidylyltransferase